MIARISRKLAEGKPEDFSWITDVDQLPQKILLETDQDNTLHQPGTGTPAVKIGNVIFYFGQPHDKVTRYRVVPLWTTVVNIQE